MSRSARLPVPARASIELFGAQVRWHDHAMALDTVDAVTTEMVRLRCARHHDCRTCMSVRLGDADPDGLDRAMRGDTDALAPHHRLAVSLAEALMTQPAGMSDELVAGLREHFTDEQLVELTLKVMKFNVQKAMVALGTDTAVEPEDVPMLSWNPDGAFVPRV
jgi:alkylhydroperoxidase family enzyme